MPKIIEYKCCICHKKLKRDDTIRLLKQIYGVGRYNQFYPVDKYDFCKRCYSKFDIWLNKHKED